MRLHSAQIQIAADLHRFRVVNCGRRFGKTVLAIDQMKACAAQRQSRIAYIAPTFQQARDIAWAQLRKDFAQAGATINESRLEIKFTNTLGTESFIVLRGWESIETLRGQSFDLIVLDEVASMRNFWEAWQEVVRPTLTDRKGEALFISTPKGFNHFYDLFNLQESDSDFKSFHFTSYDNPYIPKEEIDTAKNQLTETRFAQEYMADFRKTEGLVYKEFDRARHRVPATFFDQVHVVDEMAGLDWGFNHPCAIISIKKDSQGRYFVHREMSKSGKTEPEIIEYTRALGTKVYPDPENAAGIESLRRAGVNVREVIKGKGSVAMGISRVQELFKNDKLFISEDCPQLIWGLETYCYDEDSKEPDKPLKENDDEVDALRYPLMMNSAGGSGIAHQSTPSSITRFSQRNSLIPRAAQSLPSTKRFGYGTV